MAGRDGGVRVPRPGQGPARRRRHQQVRACVHTYIRRWLLHPSVPSIHPLTHVFLPPQHTHAHRRLDRLRRQQATQEEEEEQKQDTTSTTTTTTALTSTNTTTSTTTVIIGRAEPAPAALDLGSLHSVRAFARAYHRSGRPLSVLVNNAAAMFARRGVADAWGSGDEEGDKEEAAAMRRPVERTMLVNHLGPWLLTSLLLPTLKDTGVWRAGLCALLLSMKSERCIHNYINDEASVV